MEKNVGGAATGVKVIVEIDALPRKSASPILTHPMAFSGMGKLSVGKDSIEVATHSELVVANVPCEHPRTLPEVRHAGVVTPSME